MYRRYIKKILDLSFVVLMLPFFLVISFVVGLLIYLEDGGSILYKGLRLGKNGRIFTMYKFRSMKMGAPDLRNWDGSTYNAINDVRVTRIGRFIRKTSIDELPQFINILKNDMSIIGPRPDLPEHLKCYVGEEKRKLEVLPGITGYNQAYYRNSVQWKQRLKRDVYYVEHLSFSLDVKVFFKTLQRIVARKGIWIQAQEQNEKVGSL